MTKKESVLKNKIVLVTDTRIKLEDRDPDLHYYDIRHSDEGYSPAQLKRSVMVNYMFTIATSEPLELDPDWSDIVLYEIDAEEIYSAEMVC